MTSPILYLARFPSPVSHERFITKFYHSCIPDQNIYLKTEHIVPFCSHADYLIFSP